MSGGGLYPLETQSCGLACGHMVQELQGEGDLQDQRKCCLQKAVGQVAAKG